MNSNLKNVTSYIVSERDTESNIIHLDWNENQSEDELLREFLTQNLPKLNKYSDPNNTVLRNALSKYTNVSSEHIEVFNGSDAALDLAFKTLLNPGDTVLIPSPNYSQVNQTIQSFGANIRYTSIEHLRQAIGTVSPKVVYLSNPNNPIGYVYSIINLIDEFPDVYFIVDEAYHEYAPQYTVFNKAGLKRNLIVTRTFSKALGLAGLRLGYLTANEQLLKSIRSIKNFKEVNTLAAKAGTYILEHIDRIEEQISQTIEIRNNFHNKLRAIGVTVYTSYANFILIQHSKIETIISELLKEGIQIRDRQSFIPNTARITIGDKAVMDKVFNIIKTVV